MTRVIAIGEDIHMAGYALAGVEAMPASTVAEAQAAWCNLPEDTTVLLLDPDAHRALAEQLDEGTDIVWAVLPE
jgi:vacuolar-type H+-ATPase subunit F/Vma7